MLSALSVQKFLRSLASPEPFPGGGSAACLVSAAGISLALMVGGISRRKKKSTVLQSAIRELETLLRKAVRAIDGDVKAYQKVVRAYAVPKGRPGRERGIEAALKGGYEFQKDFAGTLLRARARVAEIQAEARGSIASDLVLSRHFLRAGFLGALQTARVNLDYLKEERFQKEGFKALESLESQYQELERA